MELQQGNCCEVDTDNICYYRLDAEDNNNCMC